MKSKKRDEEQKEQKEKADPINKKKPPSFSFYVSLCFFVDQISGINRNM
jgi:hypothetical protein